MTEDSKGAGVAHDPHPVVTYYPRCGKCRIPCVLRQHMTFGGGDLATKWLWARDCKHKKAALEIVSPDGTVEPNGGAK